MQEFDAERLAISPPQDGDDLADGAEFKTKHLVEKNRPVKIALAEAVGARIEFLFVIRRLQTERIEVGVKMPARAIGANQHQRTDRIAGRALHIGRRKLDALGLRLRLYFGAESLAGFGPIAVERRSQLGSFRPRPIGPPP